jgi:hypothetical protein
MPNPLVAHPETLKIIRAVHDTLHVVVRDTVVRVAEPQTTDRAVAIVSGIATIIAAIVAVWGIRAWRHRLKGSTEYRLAIRLYVAVIRLRDHIRAARELLNHQVPTYEGERDANTPEIVERARKEYWTWFREVIRSALALKAIRPEAEIHWGFEATRHIDDIEGHAHKMQGSYSTYYQFRLKVLRGEHGYEKAVESCRTVIFNTKFTDQDKDEYGEALEALVERAREYLKRKIEITK